MLRYGLTGGIASGKTTVAAMLREYGFPVLEADKISHALIQPAGAGHEKVLARFGCEILDPGGAINHSRLAAVVFNDREKLNELNSILHPLVEQEVMRRLAELERAGETLIAFVEAALIFEAGLHTRLAGVVVCWCLPEQQLARLIQRGLSQDEAQKRIAMQMPVEKKLALATERIDCSGSLETTRRQVDALTARLRLTASRG
jgi:dephospho-CoA kinase